jgi:hypothetical protein
LEWVVGTFNEWKVFCTAPSCATTKIALKVSTQPLSGSLMITSDSKCVCYLVDLIIYVHYIK